MDLATPLIDRITKQRSDPNTALADDVNTVKKSFGYITTFKEKGKSFCGNADKEIAFCKLVISADAKSLHLIVSDKNDSLDKSDFSSCLDTIELDDVIGAEVITTGDGYDNIKGNYNHEISYLHIYCYPKTKPNETFSKRIQKHRKYEFDCDSASDALACASFLQSSCSGFESVTNKKYLVLVNPVSGQKKAMSISKNIVKPMFDQAKISYEIFATQYSGHAKDWAMQDLESYETQTSSHCYPERDLKDYRAVIAIGGDGLLAEVLQGMKNRKDYSDILKSVTFGIIGGGTSNGLAASILYKNSVCEHIYLICCLLNSSISQIEFRVNV